MRQINKVIIHCSDSDIPAHDDISVIDKWHKERGWAGVGYHFFINSDGDIQIGRKLEEVGAHCYGENDDSIGICLHGKTEFTEIQFRNLNNLIQSLLKQFPGMLEVEGHYSYSNKTCPNFNVQEFKLNYDIRI